MNEHVAPTKNGNFPAIAMLVSRAVLSYQMLVKLSVASIHLSAALKKKHAGLRGPLLQCSSRVSFPVKSYRKKMCKGN